MFGISRPSKARSWYTERGKPGRSDLMLEETVGRVYYIYRTPEMEEARGSPELDSKSFIRLRKLSTARGAVVEIRDMGDSEAILRNKSQLREIAREMIQQGHSLGTMARTDGSAVIRKRGGKLSSIWNEGLRKNGSDSRVQISLCRSSCWSRWQLNKLSA